MSAHDSLPYTDTKPQGAADFYYAINATFAFVHRKLGRVGLLAYWDKLGKEYMRPVWTRWREQGLAGVASYWKAFFAAEPGGEAQVEHLAGEVVLTVRKCPAITHLRTGNREILPEFCQHCYFVSEAAACKAGYTVRVCGGNGSCVQRFLPADSGAESQKMEEIVSC